MFLSQGVCYYLGFVSYLGGVLTSACHGLRSHLFFLSTLFHSPSALMPALVCECMTLSVLLGNCSHQEPQSYLKTCWGGIANLMAQWARIRECWVRSRVYRRWGKYGISVSYCYSWCRSDVKYTLQTSTISKHMWAVLLSRVQQTWRDETKRQNCDAVTMVGAAENSCCLKLLRSHQDSSCDTNYIWRSGWRITVMRSHTRWHTRTHTAHTQTGKGEWRMTMHRSYSIHTQTCRCTRTVPVVSMFVFLFDFCWECELFATTCTWTVLRQVDFSSSRTPSGGLQWSRLHPVIHDSTACSSNELDTPCCLPKDVLWKN